MRKTRSVSELLGEGKATLERLKAGSEAANRTLVALQRNLPPELAGHVFGATLDEDGLLTIVIDSAAFATRLRYLLPEALPATAEALGTPVERARVRVRARR